jgi:hypothetical protein
VDAVAGGWKDQVIEQRRARDAWLLDWQQEISAVVANLALPVDEFDPAEVAPRLGAVLTLQAWHLGAVEHSRWRTEQQHGVNHPESHLAAAGVAVGRRVFVAGLAAHLDLDRTHAEWLAGALIDHEQPLPAAVEKRLREQLRKP